MLGLRQRGVSMIEVMIGIAIVAILSAVGLPAFGTFLQNSKLRSTAESFYAGLQAARTEAVKRNSQVQFIMTTDEPGPSTLDTTNLSPTAVNWMIRALDPTAVSGYAYVMSKSAAEGGGSGLTVQVDGGAVSAVTFTAFGATTLGSAATLTFTNPTGGACASASGPMRCLNVVVSIGGQIRMCDPKVTDANDTRKC
jgi:type IV fimbrial biogenesis protein FimT